MKFFETDNLSFIVIDVVDIRQKNVHIFNKGRNFHALSLRTASDAVLSNDKDHCQLKDHSVCFVPANMDYSRIALVDEMIVIHFQLDNFTSSDIQHFVTNKPDILHSLFLKILTCWQEKAPGYRYQCTGIFYEIIALCYQENATPISNSSPIEKSVAYLSEHFADPDLSIKKLAAMSYMSEVYFRKLFKKMYGISPVQYRLKLRIQKAKNLLSTGYYTMKEVASISGFHDTSYFSTVFHQVTGMTPTEYAHTPYSWSNDDI